jgi:hypothetical protein
MVKVQEVFLVIEKRASLGCAIEVYGSRRRLERSNCRYAHAPFNADGNGGGLTADKGPLFTLAPNGVAIGKVSGVKLLEGLLGHLPLVAVAKFH